jgi:hypothetical protein
VTDFRGFRGAAKPLEDLDLPRIGRKIDVGEDELHAFVDVESAGRGFGPEGRPIILYEPHVFYRQLPNDRKGPNWHLHPDICYPRWGAKPYPKTQDARYKQLERAIKIDEAAGLKACSWGLTQILGENYRAAGYDSVQEMVLAFMDDEDAHLEATVKVLQSMGIDDDLRAHRWAVVAARWNGPGYAKNEYDVRLKRAYEKWRKIKDTLFTLELLRTATPGAEVLVG